MKACKLFPIEDCGLSAMLCVDWGLHVGRERRTKDDNR